MRLMTPVTVLLFAPMRAESEESEEVADGVEELEHRDLRGG